MTYEAKVFTDSLFYAWRETFDQVQGVYLDKGTSLFETLAGISAEVASRPVGRNCATIAAQVAHLIFYMDVLERYILGTKTERADWQHIWNTVSGVTPAEWEASLVQLRVTHDRLLTMLQGITEWQGNQDFGLAFGIVLHTAYHLGEIRQALCTVGE